MDTKRKWFWGVAAAVVVLSLAAVIVTQVHRAQAAEHTLAETTLAALSDAAEETQALALAMDKLGIAASTAQSASLLHEAVLSADRARHSLASLPAEPAVLAPVLSYLSRLSDTAGALLTRMGSGLPVTGGEIADLSAEMANLRLLHAELDLARASLLEGESIASALPSTAVTASPDAAELATYRALPSEEIGSGMALQLAKAFVGLERVVSVAPAPDVSGALPTFGVTIQTADVQLNLEITRRGGKVLLMSPETAGFAMTKSVEECQQAASEFLASRGFASMTPTYYQIYDGLCVMTFVHMQQSALVWSDRVVAQVRMDTAEVVGIEARSYWKNHIPRQIGTPLLTQSEARAGLSAQVEVLSARLAVLPVGAQERLCWQFTVTHNDDTYISFIDAITGREVLLEKVMQLEYGSMPA